MLGSAVTGIARTVAPLRIAHAGGVLEAGHALVCADTCSDRLAVLAGAPPEPRAVPFRGGFLRVRRDRSHLVR